MIISSYSPSHSISSLVKMYPHKSDCVLCGSSDDVVKIDLEGATIISPPYPMGRYCKKCLHFFSKIFEIYIAEDRNNLPEKDFEKVKKQ